MQSEIPNELTFYGLLIVISNSVLFLFIIFTLLSLKSTFESAWNADFTHEFNQFCDVVILIRILLSQEWFCELRHLIALYKDENNRDAKWLIDRKKGIRLQWWACVLCNAAKIKCEWKSARFASLHSNINSVNRKMETMKSHVWNETIPIAQHVIVSSG